MQMSLQSKTRTLELFTRTETDLRAENIQSQIFWDFFFFWFLIHENIKAINNFSINKSNIELPFPKLSHSQVTETLPRHSRPNRSELLNSLNLNRSQIDFLKLKNVPTRTISVHES